MGMTLHYAYYPKKCDDIDILPYLYLPDNECFTGLSTEFFKACRDYAEYNEENGCYIFRDKTKLYPFAALKEVPAVIADYIVDPIDRDYKERKADDILILWVQ